MDGRETLSFAAAGWLQMYLFGVGKAVQDVGLTRYNVRFAGSSAGSLASAALVLGVDFEEVRQYAIDACADARRGPQNAFKIRTYVETAVEIFAVQKFQANPQVRSRLEDQLEVYATVLPWCRPKVLNTFETVDDLAEALTASCCITPLAGMPFPLRRTGEVVCDGGLASFQPRKGEPNVITISPMYFSRADIRPSRYVPAWWGLYPPDVHEYDKIFHLGYDDAIAFFLRTKRLRSSALKKIKGPRRFCAPRPMAGMGPLSNRYDALARAVDEQMSAEADAERRSNLPPMDATLQPRHASKGPVAQGLASGDLLPEHSLAITYRRCPACQARHEDSWRRAAKAAKGTMLGDTHQTLLFSSPTADLLSPTSAAAAAHAASPFDPPTTAATEGFLPPTANLAGDGEERLRCPDCSVWHDATDLTASATGPTAILRRGARSVAGWALCAFHTWVDILTGIFFFCCLRPVALIFVFAELMLAPLLCAAAAVLQHIVGPRHRVPLPSVRVPLRRVGSWDDETASATSATLRNSFANSHGDGEVDDNQPHPITASDDNHTDPRHFSGLSLWRAAHSKPLYHQGSTNDGEVNANHGTGGDRGKDPSGEWSRVYRAWRNLVSLRVTLHVLLFGAVPINRQRLEEHNLMYRVFRPLLVRTRSPPHHKAMPHHGPNHQPKPSLN